MENNKIDTKTLISVISLILSIVVASLVGAGVLTPQQGTQYQSQITSLEQQITDLEALINQPVNSTLSAMRKAYSYQCSFVGSYLTLAFGVNGTLILPYSTNCSYIGTNAI